ncbi:MAG: DUF2851 family protein [Verrucomicrobia bacterium]|nr:DUF2851 family protein [Verrucomicrobiota bacterium]
MPNRCRKSNGQVVSFPSVSYAQWRAQALSVLLLRESPDGTPTERFLQTIWLHQRLRRDGLVTGDGRAIRILHPGFWNHEAGPDFRDALIQFNDDFPQTGDVEIDLHPSAWHGHGHDVNPAYRGVRLHVVWAPGSAKPASLPTLVLQGQLDSPLDELRHWLGVDTLLPDSMRGRCQPLLRDWPDASLRELLRQAAEVRLQRKGQELAARAREVGWNQALQEALFAALGYKHNVWPMRRLAELLPQLLDSSGVPDRFQLHTRLLGVGGLLPAELTRSRPTVDDYTRRAWDLWWREKETYDAIALPERIWRFHGFRPSNHPQRRLALAAQWVVAGDLPQRLESWLAAELPPAREPSKLMRVLQGQSDPFWSWHWNLHARRLARPQPLLGPQRVTDLAINVILPWLRMRAVIGANHPLQQVAEQRYFDWPAAEDNATLRLARQRLLGGPRPRFFRTAALQQGLLQIERDFCQQSNALCEHCPFPGLLDAYKDDHECGAARGSM